MARRNQSRLHCHQARTAEGGGEVAAYRVQRRTRDGDWTDVGMSVESEVTLNGQQAGVEYEYRVIAVNKAGEGPASNTARAVL